MVNLQNREEVPRKRLLYDPLTLEQMIERYGSTHADIKLGIKTGAHLYEIRTAMRYWTDGSPSHRTSDAIWERCKAVDSGQWALNDDNELVDGEQ